MVPAISPSRENLFELIQGLKKGDVVALNNDLDGPMGNTLVFVDKVDQDYTIVGSYNGFFDGDDRMIRSYWFEYISKIEVVARADSFAARVLNDQVTRAWLNHRRLQRIEQRVATKNAELSRMIE